MSDELGRQLKKSNHQLRLQLGVEDNSYLCIGNQGHTLLPSVTDIDDIGDLPKPRNSSN
jgi:hypothetical protein